MGRYFYHFGLCGGILAVGLYVRSLGPTLITDLVSVGMMLLALAGFFLLFSGNVNVRPPAREYNGITIGVCSHGGKWSPYLRIDNQAFILRGFDESSDAWFVSRMLGKAFAGKGINFEYSDESMGLWKKS